MNGEQLGQAMWAAPVPPSDAGLARTIQTVSQLNPGPRRTPWARRLAIAACIGALVAVSFTPPGRAVARWVGETIGVVGGPPTVSSHPDQDGAQAVVVGAGAIPSGDDYELVAFESEKQGTCLAFDRPGLETRLQFGGSLCRQGQPVEEPVAFHVATDEEGRFGSAGRITVVGETEADVARVVVSYTAADGTSVEAPSISGVVDGALQRQIGAKTPFGVFVGFLPAEVLQSAQVTGYSAEDEEIGQAKYPAEHFVGPPWVSKEYASEHGARDRDRREDRFLELITPGCEELWAKLHDINKLPPGCDEVLGLKK